MSLIRSVYLYLMRNRIAAANDMVKELECRDRLAIESTQVDRFNDVWAKARRYVPLYRDWQIKYNLPDCIRSLKELRGWPILTKNDLRDVSRLKREDVAVPNCMLMTGGSTGAPVKLPTWSDTTGNISQIVGRRRYGVDVGDKVFLLWGHEHLYGKGFYRRMNILKRRLKDWLAGWVRVSAYDLSSVAMKRAYAEFAKSQAEVVIGFSPAVLSFVRNNNKKKDNVHERMMKAVLCTAGPLDDSEKQEISDFFNAPVMMEYGSVECAIMAYTRPLDGWYEVFWNTHLLQAVSDDKGEFRNIVTRLTDCYVPLIRYDIGDYLESPDDVDSVLLVKCIKGRPSEMITFSCGVSFFGALIGDCVKQVQGIIASQIAVNERLDVLEIRVVADKHLSNEDMEVVLDRLSLTVKDFGRLRARVVQVSSLSATVGGKTPRVIKL